jgi:predicted NAD/FAD-binding protein
MRKVKLESDRPDVDAAVRGGDWSLPMDGEGIPEQATLKQALYWRQIYSEILAMEEKVLHRIRQLMAKQSAAGRREVELTNVPVVVAQAEKFRQRLGYWEARIQQLSEESSGAA